MTDVTLNTNPTDSIDGQRSFVGNRNQTLESFWERYFRRVTLTAWGMWLSKKLHWGHHWNVKFGNYWVHDISRSVNLRAFYMTCACPMLRGSFFFKVTFTLLQTHLKNIPLPLNAIGTCTLVDINLHYSDWSVMMACATVPRHVLFKS